MKKRRKVFWGLTAVGLMTALLFSPGVAFAAEMKEAESTEEAEESNSEEIDWEEEIPERLLSWGDRYELDGDNLTLYFSTGKNQIIVEDEYKDIFINAHAEGTIDRNDSYEPAQKEVSVLSGVNLIYPDVKANVKNYPSTDRFRIFNLEKLDDTTYEFELLPKTGSGSKEFTLRLVFEDICEHNDYTAWDANAKYHWLVCAECGEKAPKWLGHNSEHGDYSEIKKVWFTHSEAGYAESTSCYLRTCGVCDSKITDLGKSSINGGHNNYSQTLVKSKAEFQALIDEEIRSYEESWQTNQAENLSRQYNSDSSYEVSDEDSDDVEGFPFLNGSWAQDATGWWFVKNDGSYPINSWFECRTAGGNGWYHFNSAGYMDHGLFTDTDGNTYCLSDTQGSTYGAMLTGWQWIGGKCYYFNPVSGANGLPAGAMYRNAVTPDGYTVNEAGEWTITGVVQTIS